MLGGGRAPQALDIQRIIAVQQVGFGNICVITYHFVK
jgi:hypothetical protein